MSLTTCAVCNFLSIGGTPPNSHGEGKAIVQFKVKPILSWTPNQQIIRDGILTLAPKMPIEKICIDIITRPCNVNNL